MSSPALARSESPISASSASQLALTEIISARSMREAGVDSPPGIRDLAVHARQLEPVGLGSVELDDVRVQARERHDVRCYRGLERGADPVFVVDMDSSAISPSSACVATRAATWCCSRRTSRVTSAVTLGLPSRSPPIHVPNVSGCAAPSSTGAMAGQFFGQIGSKIGHCLLGDFLEVVERVAGFVGWRGTLLAQLVGLPDEINDFGERSVLAGSGGAAGRRWYGEYRRRRGAASSAWTAGSLPSGER